MPAQNGDSLILGYGPQGSQQNGGTLVLQPVALVTATRVTASTRAPWNTAQRRERVVVATQNATLVSDTRKHAPWGEALGQDTQERSGWAIAEATDQMSRAPWGRFTSKAQRESRAPWFISRAVDKQRGAPWGRYTGVAQPESLAHWLTSTRQDFATDAPWGAAGAVARLVREAAFAASARADLTQWVPWVKFSRTLQSGVVVQIPPDDGVPTALIVVPVRSVYMQVNVTSLRRVAGNVALPTISLNMSLDVDSWSWSFSAQLPAAAMTYVEPIDGEPVELEANVNGEQFRLLVERISRSRTFGKASISISGRSRLSRLDAPTASVMSFVNESDATLQQIIGDVLSDNGVSMGYDVTFGPEDWLVPAGVWQHRGTRITALNEIAAAAGAYLQPHPTADAISILPRYPFMPWEWDSLVDPDYELPSALMTKEDIEWFDKPVYNRVFVSGVSAGVLGQVTRAGTAGDLVAQTVTHPLITTAAAARQRGRPILADTGRGANVSLRLPVLDDTGVILPGKYVRYVDGAITRVGLVRSVGLDIGMPQVWQTIKLETHL